MDDRRKKDNDLYKEAIKEAIYQGVNDWLERTYTIVGRWTVRGIFALIFALTIRFLLTIHIPDIRQIILDTIRP